MMGNLTFILTVAMAAAFVLLVVGLVVVIIYYRCRLKEIHRTLARLIKENLMLREAKP
jgi:Sec-independent protein translocase protein TatA